MPVSADSSFVPDSTSGISPVSTPAVKRAARTYGRPRHVEPTPGDDSDTSLIHSAKSSGSRISIYRTGPPDMDEEIPQSSDPLSDGREDDGHKAPFAFSWRDKLKEIDDRDDFDMDMTVTGEEQDASSSRVESDDELQRPSQTKKTTQLPTSPADSGIDALAEQVFGGSLSTLTASSVSPQKSQSSPQPTISTRRRKNRTIRDSDSEDDNTKESSATSPSSFHAPASQSTPPTSQGDMPTNSKRGSKGKTKPPTRRDVAPLLFSEDPVSSSTSKSAKASSKDKRKKIKPPTKQELRDTARNRIRIAAEQEVSIPRTEAQSHLSLHSFFLKLQNAASQPPVETDADPIEPFSDPVSGSPYTHVAPAAPTSYQIDGSPPNSPKYEKILQRTLDSFPASDDDEEDLPELGAVLANEKTERDRAKRDQNLKELKLRALAATSRGHQDSSDSDDDLQVTHASQNPQVAVKEEADERKSGRKKLVSEGRKRQLNLGGIGLAKQKAMQTPTKVDDLQVLKGTGLRKGKTIARPTTQIELNRVLAARVEAASLKITKEKQEQWRRRGGKVKDAEGGTSSSVHDASTLYAAKGLKLPPGRSAVMDVDEEGEEEGDEDWVPGAEERGSASPSPSAVNSGNEEDVEHDQVAFEEEDITMVNDTSPTATQDEDTVARLPKFRRPTVKHIVESDSEGENDENSAPVWTPSTLASPRFPPSPLGAHGNDDNAQRQPHSKLSPLSRRRSLSSMDYQTEDEGDKENEKSRMWDRGDDKENQAVVRHSVGVPFGSRQASLFGLEVGPSRGLSMSPASDGRQDVVDEDSDEEKNRRLLMDDPFASSSRSAERPTSFEARLKQASPVSVSLTPSLTPFIGGSKTPSFSQFLDDEPASVLAPAPLQGSFSDLFEYGTERPKAAPLKRTVSGSFSGPVSPRTNFAGTSFENDLSLTQDISLQPAFQVSGNLLRKADQIFEKEQEYVLEAANKKPQAEPELYVNDHGFLTQTRPDVCSPEVYRPPTPMQDAVFPPSEPQASSVRRPLRTISLADELDFESESPAPLHRLRKRGATPTSPLLRSSRTSISPSPSLKRPATAFDVMKRAAKDRTDKPKRKLERSEFIEQEAQESDEDDMFGFGPKKNGGEDEEDGEDLDQPLASLVDDNHMDEEAVAAQLVMEKYKEQEQADDLELEKLHQAAVHGEFRKKRRKGGIDMDDSDDDSEDETNRRIRQNMHKKQRIDRDNIKALGEHEETKSFFAVYENDLAADGADFSYLEETQPQDVDMANEEEDGEERPRETVSVAEIVQRARELARQPQDVDGEPLDPHDVNWIDVESDEETLRVKPVKNAKKQPVARPRGIDLTEIDGTTDMPPPKSLMEGGSIDRMKSWAKVEGRSRQNGTTGRSVGGAAVTGHKAKSGGGSLRNAASSASSKPTEQRRPVKAQPSLLASVAAERRTTRFA
ncbi:hypothetical protein DXG03_007412 [Asterophora parasitica]|uniref:DNA replication checkpoint mediator MRC1 domain-containing protein n=1 Tax=Asterophora parasitica TaxID=117018 RepID=A0A9P7GD06_9AGAR|nr:hypothetical protein DXG03_007412 [Asterophora parasitica]